MYNNDKKNIYINNITTTIIIIINKTNHNNNIFLWNIPPEKGLLLANLVDEDFS